ncbi:MAG: dethiobiotin synthase [Caulobacteraceae bacterium]|nr:dethiobiotin synthase [Caulobacteraceae bacterium]
MTAFFVTGAGTDIGKTWVSAALLRFWRVNGLQPAALKPVASGYDPSASQDSDGAVLLAALGRPVHAAGVEAITPFRLRAPLSPDQAAAREGVRLTVADIAAVCAPLIAQARGPMLIEGAGGVMSPLNESETMLDLAVAFGAPAIFVCGSYLGAISHALTGLAALKGRGAAAPLVLVNETPGSAVDLSETVATLAAHAGTSRVLAVRRGGDSDWGQASRALGVAA